MENRFKRIVISSAYNDLEIPSMFEEKLNEIKKNANRNIRIILAELIDGLPVNYDASSTKVVEVMNELGTDYLRYDDTFYFRTSIYDWVELSIVEIDTSRPWILKNYDGLESVTYIDDFKVIDEELNLHECTNREFFN